MSQKLKKYTRSRNMQNFMNQEWVQEAILQSSWLSSKRMLEVGRLIMTNQIYPIWEDLTATRYMGDAEPDPAVRKKWKGSSTDLKSLIRK